MIYYYITYLCKYSLHIVVEPLVVCGVCALDDEHSQGPLLQVLGHEGRADVSQHQV